MRSSRPYIGVTGPRKGGASAWWFTALGVWLQGGRPLRIYPGRRPGQPLDGLILGGGADISPERYGQMLQESPTTGNKRKGWSAFFKRIVSFLLYPLVLVLRYFFSTKDGISDVERDELEFDLLQEACEKQIPILGICRGAQLINVKFGGTLHQEIEGFYTEVPKADTIWPRKEVEVEAGSRLYCIMEAGSVRVNALHHQAVDTLGEEIEISAAESNGIIQAIEHPRFDYLVGVQWHPEYMPQIAVQRRLFARLVEAAQK